MYVCVYVRMYVCVCVCVRLRVCAYLCLFVCEREQVIPAFANKREGFLILLEFAMKGCLQGWKSEIREMKC